MMKDADDLGKRRRGWSRRNRVSDVTEYNKEREGNKRRQTKKNSKSVSNEAFYDTK